MGMSIADNIDFLNEAKKLFEDIANNPKINETIKTYFIIESLETAIETMRKYQKIEEIVNTWRHDITAGDYHCMAEVAEVVEDGNDD